MKAIKTRSGISSFWVWFLTLSPSTILLWLPVGMINVTLLAVLLIVSVSVIYPLTTLLPRPHIFSVFSDTEIVSNSGTINSNEVTLLELVDCGKFSGWEINLYTKWGNSPSISFPIERIENGESLTIDLPKKLPAATGQTRILPWGKISEWLMAIVLTMFALGLLRFIVNIFFS